MSLSDAIKRRQLAALALGGASAGAMAALPCRRALGQTPRRLSVITAAAYKKSFDQYIVPKMLALYDVQVVSSAFLSAEALARALAQKSNPQISVFSMDQGPWLQGKDAGLWAELGPAVTNLQDMPAKYVDADRRGAAMEVSLLGMLYDRAALKAHGIAEPISIFDMWNPAYRDRIGLEQFSSSYAFALLAYITRLQGGDVTKSFDPGFDKLKQLRPNIHTFFGQAAQLSQLIQQKEIWLAWGGHFTAMQATAAGTPIQFTAPKEGAPASAHFVAIAEGSPNRQDAERLVDLMLSPEFETVMAEVDFQAPVNVKTRIGPEFAKRFPVSEQAIADAVTIPWGEYNRHRVELNERWQREIEQ